jgi:hypothetical protein
MNSGNTSIPMALREVCNKKMLSTTITGSSAICTRSSNEDGRNDSPEADTSKGVFYATPTDMVHFTRPYDTLSTNQVFHKYAYVHADAMDPFSQQRRIMIMQQQVEKQLLARQQLLTVPYNFIFPAISNITTGYDSTPTRQIPLASNDSFFKKQASETAVPSIDDGFKIQNRCGNRITSVAQSSSCSPTISSLPEYNQQHIPSRELSCIVTPPRILKEQKSMDSPMSGLSSVVVYQAIDNDVLSEYQCFVRQQMEFFAATDVDVMTRAKGRNKPIIIGQVGIRCRHCATIPPKYRSSAAMFYPRKLGLIYQTGQNLIKLHLHGSCQNIPESVQVKMNKLNRSKCVVGSGKSYWQDSASSLGIYETENDCLGFRNIK